MTVKRNKNRPDRGSGPVEFAILLLPLLLLTFMVAQAAFVFYARSTALAAATQGANAARAYNAVPGAGVTAANDFLAQAPSGGLRNPQATSTTSGNQVTVTVTGRATSIIPFLTFNIAQRATGPVERWVP